MTGREWLELAIGLAVVYGAAALCLVLSLAAAAALMVGVG